MTELPNPNKLFKLAFQVEHKGRYHQLIIYPEAKVYTYHTEENRDRSLAFINLEHYDDMDRMENRLMNGGYKPKVI